MLISQRSLQIELIFRLLLKITVERPHECDFDLICVRREAVKTERRYRCAPMTVPARGAITRPLCLHTAVWAPRAPWALAVGRGNARL